MTLSISTSNTIILAQLSDLHITHDFALYQQCLDLALSACPDVLLLTGDLINHGNKNTHVTYDELFASLDKTKIPYLAIGGNHDTTHELNEQCPFEQRIHLPITLDNRLVNQSLIICGLKIIALDSCVSGKIYGRLTPDTLDFLRHELRDKTPALIALHHHPIPVGSKWIDQYMLQNANALADIVKQHPHIQAIICGHVHQTHSLDFCDVPLWTAPAASRQFKPFMPEFALDAVPAGVQILHYSHSDTTTTKGNIWREILRLTDFTLL